MLAVAGFSFRVISGDLVYNTRDYTRGGSIMYSEEYERAKKEFKNCLWMSIIGMGVPIYNAVHEWWPIMKREKKKALSQGQAEKTEQR